MGGGFMSAASSASNPPFSAARSFPTGSQPYLLSGNDNSFGPVPSRVEVERAILELQRFMSGLSNSKSEAEGVHGHHHSKMLQSGGFIKFSEAFARMLAEPPLQNLVMSISCDKNVWDAILSNPAVHDLRDSGRCKDLSPETWNASKELEKEARRDDEMELFLRWILSFTKFKILQLVEKFVSMVDEIFRSMVDEIFRSAPKERPGSDVLDETIRSSLLLSIVILLVVVVARGRG